MILIYFLPSLLLPFLPLSPFIFCLFPSSLSHSCHVFPSERRWKVVSMNNKKWLVNSFTFYKSLSYVQWLLPFDDVSHAFLLSIICIANTPEGICYYLFTNDELSDCSERKYLMEIGQKPVSLDFT